MRSDRGIVKNVAKFDSILREIHVTVENFAETFWPLGLLSFSMTQKDSMRLLLII